ncbi:MAG: transglycosylase SLT domain-containing protein, partial [Alphaproteobacteria bacterium]
MVANAMLAVNNGNVAGALALRTRTQDSAAQKLIAWYAFSRRDGRGDFGEVAAFLRDNARWPLPEVIARTADRSISPHTPAADLLVWFADRLPETGEGLMDAVAALKAQGKAKEAQDLLRRAWATIRLTDAEEAEIVRRHGADLRSEDHAERIGHLASMGQKRIAQVTLARFTLEKPHRALVDARLKLRDESLRGRPAEVEAALAAVLESDKAKEGFLYDLMRWHRRGNRTAAALAVAAALPAKLETPERWWKEFDILIRNAIATRQYEAAYRLASNHRQTGGESLAEAEFLAGYIALRLLNRSEIGEKHLITAAKEKLGGWDVARLAYWLGRAAEARGDKVKAAEHFAHAIKYSGTFYGQLAASRLGRKELALDVSAAAAQDKFWADEIVRSAHLLRAAGDARGARLIAIRAAWNGGWTAVQHAYLAKFVLDLTGPEHREQTAVRLAKLATRDGAAITTMGFPTLDLPEANVVEPALVFAVIRQESEFVPAAKSHAGARGLMQLMPFTAKTEAGDARLPYALNRLTTDPVYNLRLGTQHLRRLSDYYQGSYPLMIAAYNAGAGRVARWLASHGDPRKGGT